jgi:primosomal protein N' (replication factor Y)
VWIQTYQPDNPTLQSLVHEGYEGFARRELEHRREAGLPPYRPMALLRAESTEPAQARGFLEDLRQSLRGGAAEPDQGAGPPMVEVLGPVAAPVQRVANRYRFQLMVLGESRRALHQALARIGYEPGRERGLRWSIDVDPYDAF